MKRRDFLGVLACLPGLAWLRPNQKWRTQHEHLVSGETGSLQSVRPDERPLFEFPHFVLDHTSEGFLLPVTFTGGPDFEMTSCLVDRPLFGFPPQSFRVLSWSISEMSSDGSRTKTAILLLKHIPEDHHVTAVNPETLEVFVMHQFRPHRCDSITFHPMHPDVYSASNPRCNTPPDEAIT